MAKIVRQDGIEQSVVFKKGTLVLDKSTNAVYVCASTDKGYDLINLEHGHHYFGNSESLSDLSDLTKADRDLVMLPKGCHITLEQE